MKVYVLPDCKCRPVYTHLLAGVPSKVCHLKGANVNI